MSKLEEFSAYVDEQMADFKHVFVDCKEDIASMAKEWAVTASEVKQTTLEKMKEVIDRELEEMKKEQEPKA